jgi:hypothetical protein
MSAPKAENGFVAPENCFVAYRQMKQSAKNERFQCVAAGRGDRPRYLMRAIAVKTRKSAP